MANRFPLECSGFLEKDPEAASRLGRKGCCDQLVMSAEVEAGVEWQPVGQVFSSPAFRSKPIIQTVS